MFGKWRAERDEGVLSVAADTNETVVVTLTDAVTGVGNRRAARAWLESQAGRHDGIVLVAVHVHAVDLVRAALGDQAAGQLLRVIGRLLLRVAGERGFVVRGAGGQFAVLSPAVDPATAAEIAGRCREALRGALEASESDGTGQQPPRLAVAWLSPRGVAAPDWVDEAMAEVAGLRHVPVA